MPAKTSCLRALLFIAGFFSAHSVLAQNTALTVEAIAREGKTLPAGETVTLKVIENGLGREQPVKIGDSFPVGVVLVTPPKVRLEVKTCNGNEIALIPLLSGTRFRVFSCSGYGEEYGLDEGKASFVVKKALDFFNVRHDRFQALVRGTTYSIEIIQNEEIRFAVEEGLVSVEREGKIRTKNGMPDGKMIATELLRAGEQRNYRLDPEEYLERHGHFGSAEAYYHTNLESDRASGDERRLGIGLYQMGMAYLANQRADEAAAMFREALALSQKRYPSGVHLDIARNFVGLAGAYMLLGGQNNQLQAFEHFGNAGKILEKLYPGGIHRETAMLLDSIGVLLVRVGGEKNIKSAIESYRKALEILRQLHPDGRHSDIVATVVNLGSAYQGLGGKDNLRQAIGIFEEGVSIQSYLAPSARKNWANFTLRNNLGLSYLALGGKDDIRQALGYFDEAMPILHQLDPQDETSFLLVVYMNVYLALRTNPEIPNNRVSRYVSELTEFFGRMSPEKMAKGFNISAEQAEKIRNGILRDLR